MTTKDDVVGQSSRQRKWVLLLGLAMFIIVPIVINPNENPFLITTIMWTFFYAYLASSWNLLAGYTGVFSFGHAAFLGIGAYSTMLISMAYGLSPWITMWAGVAISVLASLMISLPSLRLSGHYFILVTWVFEEVLRYTAQNWISLTGGGAGMVYAKIYNFSLFNFQFNMDRRPFYYLILFMLMAVLAGTYRLQSTKFGYYIRAIREDAGVAAASGIDVPRYRVLATALSAALTSIGGTFFVQYTLYVDPAAVLSTTVMTRILMTAVFGGMGTILGPTIGSLILTPVTEYVRVYFGQIAGLALVLYGLILGSTALLMPEGIIGALSKRRLLPQLIGKRVYTPPERITY